MDGSGRGIDWEAIYWEQMPRIYNYFRYRVCDDALAEDLTATTFERAWRFRDQYCSDLAAFSTWLFSIAQNIARNHFRSARREVSLDDVPPLVDHRSPERIVQRQDDLAQLAAMVKQLSARERELISLKYGVQLTNRAIAQVTGLSESNVGTILHRAVSKMRVQWEVAL